MLGTVVLVNSDANVADNSACFDNSDRNNPSVSVKTLRAGSLTAAKTNGNPLLSKQLIKWCV